MTADDGLHKTFVWGKDDATERLRLAVTIVETIDPPDDLRLPTYNAAVQLLTQAQVSASALGSLALPLRNQ